MAQVKASYSRNSATKHTGVDNLFDPARVEGLVGTGVDVAMNPVVLNDVDTSTPVYARICNCCLSSPPRRIQAARKLQGTPGCAL